MAQIDRHLAQISRRTKANAPGSTGKFSPLVFSPGGLIETETLETLNGYKMHIVPAKWAQTMRRMSVGLLRARVKRFHLE